VTDAFYAGKTRPLSWRRHQLRQIIRLCDENKQALCEAAKKDLNKHPFEVDLGCLSIIKSECVHCLDNLEEWASPEFPSVPFINAFDKAQIRKEPLGVVLVIGAWNYPFSLTIAPAVGAIAAGNSVVLKPSELSSHSAQIMAELIPKYLDKDAVCVVNGGPEETTALLEEKFDHIFYTGGTAVGKIIYEKAAKQLCPVTLELGGKSPCIVDSNCDIPIAARRIAWGRWMNCGQTCIAPDYVLCDEQTAKQLIPELQKVLQEFYGDNPKNSPNYGRIVNTRHHKRVSNLIDRSKVAFGGETDEDNLYIAPTVMNGVKLSDPVMQEEIFGPLLPIVHVQSLDDAVYFVNRSPKPLALYVFTNNAKAAEDILNRTSSGGACVNDCIMHISCAALPFGGVGNSGFGSYHGKFSFDTFTHKRGTMMKKLEMESVNTLRYPPYSEKKLGWLQFLASPKEKKSPKWVRSTFRMFVCYVVPVALCYFVYSHILG